MLVVLGACEAHGLVGSNVSAAADDEVGEGTSMPVGEDGPGSGPGSSGGTTGSGTTSTTGIDPVDETTSGVLFDVLFDDVPLVCQAPHSTSCDHLSDDPWHAMGINCPGSVAFETASSGDPSAMAVHEGPLGTHSTFTPREGARMVILSTGRASDVPRTPAELGCTAMCPSTAFDPWSGMHSLPPPIDPRRVSDEVTCAEDPGLVGTGDCSNTIEDQWNQGSGSHDYAEMRFTVQVPGGTSGFTYDFAMFSTEYPVYYQSSFNDMYIAWLESEQWTGNISFDQNGHPISINGVFLDYLDDAPELDGFAMDGHAGTRWLQTVAPVHEGEDIEVIFAIFDQTDASVDTVVLLDNVHWTCTDLPPITQPEG
ncbi:MAG: choice-of-anchor L domain-containing protein [Myxococcales bacterium]|nr:choice-of-anchor L domain-containing protein [Myxococcales bacterium]